MVGYEKTEGRAMKLIPKKECDRLGINEIIIQNGVVIATHPADKFIGWNAHILKGQIQLHSVEYAISNRGSKTERKTEVIKLVETDE
jgi:hypothetical protein